MDNLKSLGLILLTGFIAMMGLASAEDVPKATLHVEVFGSVGQKVPNPVLHLYTNDRKQDLAGARQGNTITGVPFGQRGHQAAAR